MNPIITMKNISFIYDCLEKKQKIIENLSFEIFHNEIVSIVGPEKCGKSTILSLICGIIEPTNGYISCKNTHIGYMVQNGDIFQWHNVYRNFSKTYNNIPEKYIHSSFIPLNDNCCKINSCNNYCQKKAALIKTLSSDPDLLLLDEPFSSFDLDSRIEIRNEIISLIHKEQKSAIFISTNLPEALAVSDRVFILSNIPCKIVKEFKTKTTDF